MHSDGSIIICWDLKADSESVFITREVHLNKSLQTFRLWWVPK
jgi:hypothetical protein